LTVFIVRSFATGRFWRLLHELSDDIQQLAAKNYRLWIENPSHPSLRFRKLEGKDKRFTALGIMELTRITWIWIASHADYDRLVRG